MKSSRYPEAAFLSEITASATHELRNVLAIIKESGGLISDLVTMASDGRELKPERLTRATDRVNAQVKRGADLLTGLNRLSHSLDVDERIVDLREEVDLIVFMSGRKNRNRRQSVLVEGAEGEARIRVHPLRLQMALYTALKALTEAYPEGWAISVGAERAGPVGVVAFREETDSPRQDLVLDDGSLWQTLVGLVSDLDGEVEALPAGRGIRISFKAV